MSRGLAIYSPAYRTPCDQLTVADHFLLELDSFLHDIRVQANWVRTRPQLVEYEAGHMRYLLGRLHGVRFGFSSLLIYGGGSDAVDALAEAALNEAQFLADSYLHAGNEPYRDGTAHYDPDWLTTGGAA